MTELTQQPAQEFTQEEMLNRFNETVRQIFNGTELKNYILMTSVGEGGLLVHNETQDAMFFRGIVKLSLKTIIKNGFCANDIEHLAKSLDEHFPRWILLTMTKSMNEPVIVSNAHWVSVYGQLDKISRSLEGQVGNFK